MSLFTTKYEKQLDSILHRMQMNLSNNYKDNAQSNLQELEETYLKMKAEGILKKKTEERYGQLINDYKSQLKGYSHKEQTPYWT